MKLNVKVFQFNGCNKCFNETILLNKESDLNVELISKPNEWKGERIDVAVVTGYILPNDKKILEKIQAHTSKIIAYGDCTTTGGVFGLANQKGHEVSPIKKLGIRVNEINGCLAEYEELRTVIIGKDLSKFKPLCKVCKRKSTCHYLDEVHRQIELSENQEMCFNDLGFLCTGYIAQECKERCVDYGSPCRGCKPMIERSGIRMLGMFGTLMGNIEVATEASKYGATDKLADIEDDVTNSLPDIVGDFFRFSLPSSGLPKGRLASMGSLLEDIFIGRLIEELPLITGLLGGSNAISMTLNVIEAYERGTKIEITEQTKKYREELRSFELDLHKAIKDQDPSKYKEITEKIRRIAGNMNLSNVFFGGFKTLVDLNDNFQDYKTNIFSVIEGDYKNGSIEYSIDTNGVIIKMKIMEGKK